MRLETIRQFNIKLKQRFLDKMPGWSWWSSRDASQVNCCGWNWNWNKNNCKYFVEPQHCNTTLGSLPTPAGFIKYFYRINTTVNLDALLMLLWNIPCYCKDYNLLISQIVEAISLTRT